MDRASRLHADQTGWRRCTLRIRARPQGCRGIEFRIFALRKAKYCSLHCSECILIFSLRHFELRPCICRTLFVLIYRPSGVRGRTYFDGRHSHERTLHPMYTLYSMQRSGNSYKVRLALARLGIPYKLVEIDILKGESRTPEFLTRIRMDRCHCLRSRLIVTSRSRTQFFGMSPAARLWRRKIELREPRHCSGCSSNSTAWSRTSAQPISGSR